MSSDPNQDLAVRVRGVSKCYQIYDRPIDRLKQLIAGERRRYYREFWALRDVDLEVRRGETLGLIGVNGAGKSTLLQILANTLRATTGEVEVKGRLTALLELGSGFHQEYTGRENAVLACSILGMSRDEAQARLPEMLGFADIGDFVDQPVKTYSKGMLARLAFSVYAFLEPEVFIVDEALAVGDAPFRHKCNHRFEKMQADGTAILYVSHDAFSMKHRCDRVAWLHQGRIQSVGDPSDVVDEYLAAVFHKVKPGSRAAKKGPTGAESPTTSDPSDREGSGRCRFQDWQLLDVEGRTLTHFEAPGRLEIRVSIRNEDLDPERHRIETGWRLVNLQGLPVATTNTKVEEVQVPVPEPGGEVTVRWQLDFPELKAGHYTFQLTVSQIDEEGQHQLCDRIVQAFDLQWTTDREISGLVGVGCRVDCSIDRVAES